MLKEGHLGTAVAEELVGVMAVPVLLDEGAVGRRSLTPTLRTRRTRPIGAVSGSRASSQSATCTTFSNGAPRCGLLQYLLDGADAVRPDHAGRGRLMAGAARDESAHRVADQVHSPAAGTGQFATSSSSSVRQGAAVVADAQSGVVSQMQWGRPEVPGQSVTVEPTDAAASEEGVRRQDSSLSHRPSTNTTSRPPAPGNAAATP